MGLPPESLDTLQKRVPAGEVTTDPLLTYRPEPLPADEIDCLIVFTFGYRGEDTNRDPGPVNQALADAVETFVADHPVPIYAQTTVAKLLTERGVPNVTSLDQATDADGKLDYLSTAGAAELAMAKAKEKDETLGTVGVVGFADHVGRCLLTTESVGLTARVPDRMALPDTYEPESSQPWTRSRTAYSQPTSRRGSSCPPDPPLGGHDHSAEIGTAHTSSPSGRTFRPAYMMMPLRNLSW